MHNRENMTKTHIGNIPASEHWKAEKVFLLTWTTDATPSKTWHAVAAGSARLAAHDTREAAIAEGIRIFEFELL